MNRKKFIIEYLLSDYFASGLAWTLFFIYRKLYVDTIKFGYSAPVDFDKTFYIAVFTIPLYWIGIYLIGGSYKNIYRKSRFKEFVNILLTTFFGTIFLFFLLLLDDQVKSYQTYRYTFLTLFLLQFIFLFLTRFTILTSIKKKIKNRIISFNTLIVGSNNKVLRLYEELENEKKSQGYRFMGYVTLFDDNDHVLSKYISNLGSYVDLPKIILEYNIEILILAIDSTEHTLLKKVLTLIEKENVTVKIVPDMYDFMSGMVKINYIFGAPLIEISTQILPEWQKNLKRIIDTIVSVVFLIVFSPVYLVIAISIKMDSRGKIFYRQERVGKNGNPFIIYKFRTMHVNAEKNGPELSSENDPRVTKTGKFLRKYRLDELPQFYNVLMGDMSLVGARPERKFYIDQIIEIAPQYMHLLKVQPGVTSWGQVKFGYAENVKQMIERMKFDILYIENMTLAVDFKILLYTILIVLKGKGK